MSTETEKEFDLSKYLEGFYAIESVEDEVGEIVVLNPSDDRSRFAGEGLNISSLLSRKHASGIPDAMYPIMFTEAYARPNRDRYAKVVRAMKKGAVRYDEGIFDRPPGAVLDCRHILAFIMKSHGVESLPTRFFGEKEFSLRTTQELLDGVEVCSDFHATFVQNFMVLGVPFYRTAGLVREDDGFGELLKEETRRKYRVMPTGRVWVSYHRYLDVIYAFAHSTEDERKALFASMISAESAEGINVSLGGRIRDNFYHGTGKYPPMSLRYAGELALQLVKHGVVRPLLESETLEFTDGGRKLIEILPESCDDPDRYGHFHDFFMTPPAMPLKEAARVEAWLMDYFTTLKDAFASLNASGAAGIDHKVAVPA
ncbi:hypothetical protein D3C71_301370 [compost metagenome]